MFPPSWPEQPGYNQVVFALVLGVLVNGTVAVITATATAAVTLADRFEARFSNLMRQGLGFRV